MTITHEHVRNVLAKYVGTKLYLESRQAADAAGISYANMRKVMRSERSLATHELINLAKHLPGEFLQEIVEPAGFVARRPRPLNNACPRIANKETARAAYTMAEILEDGIVDHREAPIMYGAMRRLWVWSGKFLVSGAKERPAQ